jgi:hypothetical protein
MNIKTGLSNIYGLLRSVRLTVGLLIYFAVALAAATFIPQTGGAPGPAGMSSAAGETGPDSLLALLGLTNFFISVWFILPLFVFFLNLLACTVHRIRGELKRNHWRHYGPDIIHVGILFIIISAMISFFGRQEGQLVLTRGEANALPNGYKITLLDFSEDRYADGSVKEWHSNVRLTDPGGKERVEDIRVNHPVSAGYLSLYLISFWRLPEVILSDTGGNRYTLLPRERIAGRDQTAIFLGLEKESSSPAPLVVMELRTGSNAAAVRKSFRPGDEILPGLLLKQTATRTINVFQIGYDPGFFPLMVSFLIIAGGLGITFCQRLHRGKNT